MNWGFEEHAGITESDQDDCWYAVYPRESSWMDVMADAHSSSETGQGRVRFSRSATFAIAGMVVASSFCGWGFVLSTLSQFGGQPIATTVLTVVLSMVFGLSPSGFAILATVRGRTWSSVVVTLAGVWVSILSVGWGPQISVPVVVASIVAIVFSWLHNATSAHRPPA